MADSEGTTEEIEQAEPLSLLDAARQRNAERAQRLFQQGFGLNPFDIMATRIEMLVEHLLPHNSKGRQQFELRFEQKMTEIITNTEKQAVRQRLTLPNGPGGFGA